MQIMQYVTPAEFEGRGLDTLGGSPDAAPIAGYAIDADAAYPAAIAHIQAVLAGQAAPPTLQMYIDRARALDARAAGVWELATAAYASFDPRDPADVELLADRREAIEIIRGWCLELHHLATSYAPRNVRISGSKDWKTG